VLTKTMKAARVMALKIINKGGPPGSLPALRQRLDDSFQELLSIDRYFYVVRDMLLVIDSKVDDALSIRILDTLPSATFASTISGSIAMLADVKESALFKLSSAAARDRLECVEEVLDNLALAISPEASMKDGGPFYADVMHRLSFFLVVTFKEDGQDDKKIAGKHALDVQFENVKERASSNDKKLTLDDLEIFHQYKWLLTKDQEKNLALYVKQIIAQSADPKTPAKEASSSSSSKAASTPGSDSKAKRKQKEAFDSSRAAIMKFFKKTE
jgi:hypothetical protein